MHRHDTALQSGVRHISFDLIGSTNAEALSRARAGERGPLWITAKAQDAGRGRRGNDWVSQPGNLFATLLLTNPSPPERAPELSFVAALALHDAVTDVAQHLGPRLSLKWPNDLLLDGAKFAGILIEGESAPYFAAAIGMGVNCRNHPDNTAFRATDLNAAGAAVGPDLLFAALTNAMTRRLAQWDRGNGFDRIRADWLKRADGIGKPIVVRLPESEIRGAFAGLDATGRLLLKTPDGATETVAAGDVFPLAAGR